ITITENSSMTDKPKIHVFMGAPPLTPVSDVDEGKSGQWRTMELCWQGGRLRAREDEGGIHGSDGRGEVDASSEPGELPSTSNSTPQNEQTLVNDEDMCSESVKEYLDSCFPSGQPDPGPESAPERAGIQSDPAPAQSVSVETEYLSAWTVSQALILRGRLGGQPETSPVKTRLPQTPPKSTPSTFTSSPELYSPATPTQSPRERGQGGTQQGSMELFYEPLLSQRQEEGGVILEATADGVLCSQGNPMGNKEVGVVSKSPLPSPRSPVNTSPAPPAPKRSKVSPTIDRTDQSSDQTTGKGCVTSQAHTTLARCGTQGVRYSILVAVVHPCHLKEIRVRSGASAGSCIPLASVVVTDQSEVEMKVVLWRRAAFWALTVYSGDVLLITGVMVNEDKWRGETVLQSSYSSKLLNLGQVTGSSSPLVPQNVNGRTLRSLCGYLREKRPLLVSLPPRVPQDPNTIAHARLRTLRPDTLVHALLRITHTEMITGWRAEAEGTSRVGGVLKAVLTVEQGDGQQGAVVLWGAALTWLQRINRNKDAVWVFRLLLVRESMTTGLLELHSTPWGSCEPLFPDDTRALEFYRPGPAKHTSTSLEIDLHTLLSQKYTGDVELRVHVTAFQFQGSPSQNALQRMDSDTHLESILDTVSGDITFTGCGRCAAELDTDDNGIYCPCYPCLPHTGVRRYYRPVILTVKNGESQVCVQVPPVLLQKMLLDTPPDKLSKTVGKRMCFPTAKPMPLIFLSLIHLHFVTLTLLCLFLPQGFRFRYECEGPSHGGLPGASSERNRRTYPTVKVSNYVGIARVEVQLVTHSDPPQVHAHSLVGRHCCTESGKCSVDVGPNELTAQFSNLGILHVTKKGVGEVLFKRLRDEKRRQRGQHYHFTDAEEQAILREANELGRIMDLNIVRLKFTAYLQDSNGGFSRALKPVVSNPIFDSKSPNASNLKISRMDKTSGSVLGGDEIFLLCDKVQKGEGAVQPTLILQWFYAIVFKTPPYHSTEIDRSVTVFLQLKRKKVGDCSDPKQFTYVPQIQDKEEVQRKKQKPLPYNDPWRGPLGGAGGAGRGAGGPGGAGFQFNQQMNGSGWMGSGFTCFGGGGAQMSGTTAQAEGTQQQAGGMAGQMPGQTPGQTASPLQQQLFQIAATLQSRATRMTKQTAGALLQYCTTGDVRVLLAMQRHLCGVQDENGDTPLHLAIIHQQSAVIQQLVHTLLTIQQRKVLDKLNHLSQTPLHLAVITRQVKVVDVLLRAGADPTLLDRDGRTPLHLAALAGDDVTLRVLLGHLGERYNHLVNMADYHGLHPLHLAVRKGGERCLRLLVGSGAKINDPERGSGCSALHLAVRENFLKVACTLITELKADVNMCTFGGNTPLHLAASQGSPTLCSMLIAAGADKNLENDEPLFFSSSSSDEEQEDGPIRDFRELQIQQQPTIPPPLGKEQVNPRKRPATGHTPFDLTKCQKVRDLLDTRQRPKSSQHSTESEQLDSETLHKLCELLSLGDVPWRQLAEKLNMLSLAHLYQESPSPCYKLLENYKLGGGPVEGLVEALQSLGLTEGVRLLRRAELREDKQNTGTRSLTQSAEGCDNPCVRSH
uniref:RHD domain-containing protein n=1 Tax=Oncorhynchus tshawytscha TaxID=74940 RepID=A0A8C8I0L5_ONCTS